MKMQRRKRPFYIITHRSNTIKDAAKALKLGANALECDICHDEGQFYVCHSDPLSHEDTPKLEAYLQDLKKVVEQNGYNLALLIFDLKENKYDINYLMSVIRQHFSGGICEGVAILMTHAEDARFVAGYTGNDPMVGVGVDESDIPPADLETLFRRAGQRNFSYADGITTFLDKPGVFVNITTAQNCVFANSAGSFKLIYTWVLMKEASMRKYLDTYIDGIFVDAPYIEKLKKLVSSPPYNGVYELARDGYNPYTAPPMPKYRLNIKTKDALFAGSDAFYVFTLKGSAGTLQSLPFNSNMDGRLSADSLTYVGLEGTDIGDIQSLTVQALSQDFNSDWLPESIRVESNLFTQTKEFFFNGDGSDKQWISEKTGAVTKFPVS